MQPVLGRLPSLSLSTVLLLLLLLLLPQRAGAVDLDLSQTPSLHVLEVRPDGLLLHRGAGEVLRRTPTQRRMRTAQSRTGVVSWLEDSTVQTGAQPVSPQPSLVSQTTSQVITTPTPVTTIPGAGVTATAVLANTTTTSMGAASPAGNQVITTAAQRQPTSTPGSGTNLTAPGQVTQTPPEWLAAAVGGTLSRLAEEVVQAYAGDAPLNVSTTPLLGVASPSTSSACANGTSGVDCGPAEQQTLWSRHRQEIWAGAAVLGLLLVYGVTVATQETRKKVAKKPILWTARVFGLYVMFDLLGLSLPLVGYLFAGCMWNAVSGLTSVLTLAIACIPDLLALVDLPSPCKSTSAHTSAALIGSSGVSALGMALFLGEAGCARKFFWNGLLLSIDGLLFGWAFWQGEGGGVMGLFRSQGSQ